MNKAQWQSLGMLERTSYTCLYREGFRSRRRVLSSWTEEKKHKESPFAVRVICRLVCQPASFLSLTRQGEPFFRHPTATQLLLQSRLNNRVCCHHLHVGIARLRNLDCSMSSATTSSPNLDLLLLWPLKNTTACENTVFITSEYMFQYFTCKCSTSAWLCSQR